MATEKRARWLARIDVRFLLGLLLAAASIVGVTSYVNASNATAPVYQLTHSVASGERLSLSDVRVVEVNLGSSRGLYLAPNDAVNNLFTTRPLFSGEIIPKGVLASSAPEGSVTTMLHIDGTSPEGVAVGRTVEVWATSDATMRTDGVIEPFAVSTRAEVVRLEQSSGFGASEGQDIELRIPRADLSSLLQSQSEGLQFTLVVGAGSS